MNAIDKWVTTATIHDEPRRTLWSVAFPGATIPIKSIFTCKVSVPGHQNAEAYFLDLDAITDDQRDGLVHLISTRFNIPIDEVRSEINQGVPILAEGVSVSSADQGLVFSLMADDDERDDAEEWVDEFDDTDPDFDTDDERNWLEDDCG